MAYRRLVASKDVLCLLAPLLVIGVAFGLRLWRIGAPSVSGDEVNSLFFATRSLPELVAALATREPHPPFYYLFLRGWIAAAGQSELALRLPSALFGTLGVAAGYAAGRVIGGPRAGLGAAALLALSQFSILHAQDARMYAALQAFVALYLAGLVRLVRRPDRVAWLVVALAGAGAAYTHYHGLLVVALGAAVLALITPPAGWAVRLTPYLAIGALYLPWVIAAQDIFLKYRGWMAVVAPEDILRRALVAYSVGEGVAGPSAGLALIVVPALALIGLSALLGAGRRCPLPRRWVALLLGLSALPLAAVVAGSLAGRPLFHERYLIVITPAYFLLAGLGLACLDRLVAGRYPLGRIVGWIGVAAWAAIALPAYYWPTTPDKPDFRAVVAHIEGQATPPARLVMPEPQGPIVAYYLKDRLPTYVSPQGASVETVAADLDAHLAGSREAWFVRYSAGAWDDPIGHWLETNGFYLADVWISKVRVVTYALASPGELIDQAAGGRTHSGIEVTGVRVGPGSAQPGDRALASLTWDGPDPSATAKVSLRLLDPWDRPVAALDRPLHNPAGLSEIDPPRVWQGALTIPDDASLGRYRLEARFYDGSSGQSWPVLDAADREQAGLHLGDLVVEPVADTALRPGAPVSAAAAPVEEGLYLDHIRLAGGPYSPDTRLQVDWVWVAQADHPGPIAPEVAVRSAAGATVASSDRAQSDSAAGRVTPLSRLRAGERVRDHLEIPLRSIREPGAYSVELRPAPDAPWTPIGGIEVATDPSRYRRPDLPQERSDLFAGSIRLVGAELPTEPAHAGTTLPVRLAWHAEQPPAGQYTVFVHLVDEAGQLRAQSDQVPAQGTRPTADWIAGEYVLDEHRLALPADLPPGAYRLIAGLYDSATGRRAPVTAGAAGPGVHDVVELGRVRMIGG